MIFYFKNHDQAQNFIRALKEIIDRCGYASLADAHDLYYLLGENSRHYDGDNNKIWHAHPYPLVKAYDDVVVIEEPKSMSVEEINRLFDKRPVIGKLVDTKTTDKGITFKFQTNAPLSFSKGPKLYINTDIENVIFNGPVTIVFWKDGTKTVVKCENETYDPEKGLAMAIAKRTLGNKGNYYEIFKKWLPDDNAKTAKHTNNWIAYNRLTNALHDKKATKHDLYVAIQEAIKYLDI